VCECMRVTDVFMASNFCELNNISHLFGTASVKLTMQQPGKGYAAAQINYFRGTIEQVGIWIWMGT